MAGLASKAVPVLDSFAHDMRMVAKTKSERRAEEERAVSGPLGNRLIKPEGDSEPETSAGKPCVVLHH